MGSIDIQEIDFDCDGIFANTEYAGLQVVEQNSSLVGIPARPEDIAAFVGEVDREWYEAMKEKYKLRGLNVDEALAQHFDIYENVHLKNIDPFPGADVLPGRLKDQGKRLLVVSGSTSHQVGLILDAIDVRQEFEKIIACDGGYSKGKPNREPYDKATEYTGIAPENSIVLEDSRSGIRSGKSAGKKAVWVRRGFNEIRSYIDDAAQVEREIRDMTDATVETLEELVDLPPEKWLELRS